MSSVAKSDSDTGKSENHTVIGCTTTRNPIANAAAMCTRAGGRTRSLRAPGSHPSAGSPATVLARPSSRFVSRRNNVKPGGWAPNGAPECRRMFAELT